MENICTNVPDSKDHFGFIKVNNWMQITNYSTLCILTSIKLLNCTMFDKVQTISSSLLVFAPQSERTNSLAFLK